MTTQAGQMPDRVAFDAPTVGSNGYGGTVQGWTERLSCWAGIQYLRGGETVQAARLAGRQPAVVRIRASALAAQITPEWRMRDLRRDVTYNIRAVVPTDDRAFYELTVESGVAT